MKSRRLNTGDSALHPVGHLQSDFQSRRCGAVAIEYVVVCAAIIAFVVTSLLFFQVNLDFGLNELNHSISSSNDNLAQSPRPTTPGLANNSQLEARSSNQWRSFVFVGATAISLCLLSFLYIRQSRNVVKSEPEFCEVTQLQERSKALSHVLAKRASIQKYLKEDLFRLFVGEVPVCDFMTTKLRTVLPTDSVSDIRQILDEYGCRRVMVVDEEGKLLGIVSHKDLSRRTGQHASELMSTNLKTVEPNFGLSNAITIMLQQKLTCIPILEKDVLVGVLTASDLMMILQCVLVTLNRITMESKRTQDASKSKENSRNQKKQNRELQNEV